MKRVALLSKAKPRLQISRRKSYGPPVGGLNSRDALTAMKPTDAFYMLNVYPRGSYVEIRAGNSNYATGMTGNGKTLALHSAMNGTETLFCSTPSGIYNVTGSGAVGVSVLARTVGAHNWVNFGDGTNNWLIMCNGTDKPAYYNGTAWTAVDAASTPAITGVTSTTLISVAVYNGRLFFIAANTLKTWYLPAGVVGGAATGFDLSQQAARGGYLVAAMNWTFDGGSGSDDHIAFVTSMGEVIVYVGTDPSTAADWQKIGTYYVGKPIGRQCLCKYGGDLLVLTEDGVISMASALSGVVNDSKYKLSDKVRDTYLAYAKAYSTNYGWQIIFYPKENALIVNMSTGEDATAFQLVMNSQTGSWTLFNNWNSMSFALCDKKLYYCIGTKTVRAWNGLNDAGSTTTTINPIFATAYSQLDTPNFKNINAIRFQSSGNTTAATIGYGICTAVNVFPVPDGSGSNSIIPANEVNKTWWKPKTYGGEWISAYYYNVASDLGGIFQINTVEYLFEEGSIANV